MSNIALNMLENIQTEEGYIRLWYIIGFVMMGALVFWVFNNEKPLEKKYAPILKILSFMIGVICYIGVKVFFKYIIVGGAELHYFALLNNVFFTICLSLFILWSSRSPSIEKHLNIRVIGILFIVTTTLYFIYKVAFRGLEIGF